MRFTVDELQTEIGFMGVQAMSSEIAKVLVSLKERGTVLSEDIEGTTYFSYDDRFGLRPNLRPEA